MFARLAMRSDLALVGVLVAAIMLMIVPMPTVAVDTLLAFNLGASVLLLMVAFYLQTPVQFSTLPAVILIATVFRLSLSIAITRLVLVQADAGEIIRTFGEFVVAGNILVGLVIFLIITVVQFIVITKGAERIAEVAARFTLDAMPGKQMAIDADLRSGEIDQAMGRARRRALEQESQLYGAMDGAMKFVKGDAIAGLVIIVINLAGGLVVGVMQHGMSFAEAGQTYSILTVGDGLVAQIPALFVSITAGTVVTRVSGGDADSLGGEIAQQLGNDSRALWAAAVIALLIGFIPGFPTLIFAVIAAGLVVLARAATRRRAAAVQDALPRAAVPTSPARVHVVLAATLAAEFPPDRLPAAIARSALALARDLGIPVPAADVVEAGLPDRGFRVDLDGVPLDEGEIPPDSLLLRDDAENAALAGVTAIAGRALPGVADPLWVPAAQRGVLMASGIGLMEPPDVLAHAVAASLRRHAGQIVGIQETRQILSAGEAMWGELVREVQRIVPLQRTADLFRRLLDEGLPLRNLRGLLEAVLEHAGREQDPAMLAETVRAGMRRQICHAHADPLRVIGAFIVDAEAENLLRNAIQQAGGSARLNLAEGTIAALVERVRAEVGASRGPGPVVLTAMDLRRHLRALLANNGVYTPVLSFHDLLPDFTVQPLGTIRLTAGAAAAGMAASGVGMAATGIAGAPAGLPQQAVA
jgi:type III secretion protein V